MEVIRLTAVILALAALAACGRPTPMDVRGEISATNGALMAAFARGDGTAVAALYTADAQLIPPNSDFVTGRAEIGNFWQGAFAAGAARLELASGEAMAVGDTAWEIGRYELADTAGNSLDKGKYLVIWQRSGGRWYLHRDIWNTSRPARRAQPAEGPASSAPKGG